MVLRLLPIFLGSQFQFYGQMMHVLPTRQLGDLHQGAERGGDIFHGID